MIIERVLPQGTAQGQSFIQASTGEVLTEAMVAGENNMRHVHATHDLYNHIGSGKSADWVSLGSVSDASLAPHADCM